MSITQWCASYGSVEVGLGRIGLVWSLCQSPGDAPSTSTSFHSLTPSFSVCLGIYLIPLAFHLTLAMYPTLLPFTTLRYSTLYPRLLFHRTLLYSTAAATAVSLPCSESSAPPQGSIPTSGYRADTVQPPLVILVVSLTLAASP